MRAIKGKLTADEQSIIDNVVGIVFDNPRSFITPEALIIHQQRMMSDDDLIVAIEEEYGYELSTPPVLTVSKDVHEFYRDIECIPIRVDNVGEVIHLAVVPELQPTFIPPFRGMSVELHSVPIHFYVEHHTDIYGIPKFIKPIPPKDVFDIIITEAINLGAADVTITEKEDRAYVYYNVKKRRVESRRVITKHDVKEITEILVTKSSQSLSELSIDPHYFGLDIGTNHRGRIVVNHTLHGFTTTIRVLPKELFDTNLESLNLSGNTIQFIRNQFMSDEKGLRLMIGPTYSGKNTTIAAALYEKIKHNEYKTVSVESPVELVIEEIEQINCETEDEYVSNSASLLRQNADITYLSEITPRTALMTLEASNTGKVIYSSIHANSIADVLPRLQDLTGMSLSRLLLNLHSVIYQELIPTEDGEVVPVTRCLYFSREIKESLLDATLGQTVKAIGELERQWVD